MSLETTPLYLADTSLLEGTARVVSISATACAGDPTQQQQQQQQQLVDVTLDSTLFFPGGGGQPCDTGTIVSESGVRFVVEKTSHSHDNPLVIVHTGHFEGTAAMTATMVAGDQVTMSVDRERRMTNAKLHTGGHLLDCCVERLGLPLQCAKGQHSPGIAYVEYTGDLPAEQRKDVAERLNAEISRLVAEGSDVRVEMVPPAEAMTRLHVTELPPYLPADKPVRFVTVASQRVGYPCSGTHVRSLSELNGLHVTKVQKKGKELRISYALA